MRRFGFGGRLAALLLLASLAAPLGALETAAPGFGNGGQVGTLDEVTLKPLFLFSMRGRRDPFVPYALLTVPKTGGVDIDGLQFAGTLDVGGSSVALFSDAAGRNYTLRGGTLYDPADLPVAGVRGAMTQPGPSFTVSLSQGEHTLSFSATRPSKRLDTTGQP